MRIGRLIGSLSVNTIVFIGVLITIVPFVYMLSASFRPESELFSFPITLYPKETTLENLNALFGRTDYVRWYFNTFFTATVRTALATFLAAMAGYAFAKFEFRFKKLFFLLVLVTLTLPFHMLLISLFKMVVNFGWTNNYLSIIVPSAVSGFAVFLMRQYTLSVPDELLDAARIDGASETGIFLRVVLPLVRPGLGVVAILSFAATWNDYLWPLIVLTRRDMYLLSIGVATMRNPYDVEYGAIMAAAFLSTLPILIVFLAMQRNIIAGLTFGAVKA